MSPRELGSNEFAHGPPLGGSSVDECVEEAPVTDNQVGDRISSDVEQQVEAAYP